MLVTYDISNKTWSATEMDIPEVICFGFSDGKKKEVVFDNLSFGILVSSSDEVVLKETLPAEGVNYISTTEKYVTAWPVPPVAPEAQYECFLWAENADEKSEHLITFTYTPHKMFESWVWDNELRQWVPPIPPPLGDEPVYWDEETLSWIFPTTK